MLPWMISVVIRRDSVIVRKRGSFLEGGGSICRRAKPPLGGLGGNVQASVLNLNNIYENRPIHDIPSNLWTIINHWFTEIIKTPYKHEGSFIILFFLLKEIFKRVRECEYSS